MRALLPHTEGSVDRDGVNLHYEIYGQGEQTILFVPTWTFVHSRNYKAQIPYFSDHFRCVTWDPRGNGKSDRPTRGQDYGLEHYVSDALAIMDATSTEKAIVFGYSMGGPTCAVLASYHSDRVSAVVTVGSQTPLVPRFEYINEENYNSIIDNPEGWQKYNRHYWRKDFSDFAKFFTDQIFVEEHSTKQIDDVNSWAQGTTGEILAATMAAPLSGKYKLNLEAYQRIKCPMLVVHGRKDSIAPVAAAEKIAEMTDAELVIFEQAGHAPHARYPAKFNTLMRDFLANHLGTWKPELHPRRSRQSRVLYLSSPIGLGHARRDLAVTRELRKHYPDLQVDWLAQDPVTRFLEANAETLHPASRLLANESAHIEDEAGEHDLNAFQAIRNMDEILIKNFMIFQEALEERDYDLVIADEAWDVDHYWHEHPELKRSQIAWFTDFVGWVPFKENGARETYLTTDYNAEMIGHVEGHPEVRDRAIFVGGPEDIVDLSFGEGLPMMRDWIPQHYDFADYIIGQHPSEFGSREDLRAKFGYDDGRQTCIVSVGGSGVGATLIERILEAYPVAKQRIPDLRMIVVTGPRLNPARFNIPDGVEMRAFVPNLDQHLAACDLALVQGGLTTCMELAAAGTPFLYFPLRNHFEQNFHVASRLERYNAGRKMIYSESTPERIADAMLSELRSPRKPHPVATDGAARAATMIAEML